VKAVSYAGTHKMSATNHPKPKLETPSDAILRVTTGAICGSDLHMLCRTHSSEKKALSSITKLWA